MGFRKPMDFNAVYHQIYMTGVEVMSSRNDGFTAWELKKDLHQLKSLIDVILNESPTFADEQQWLDEQEQKKLVRILQR